jgi:hypothetical protein
VRRQTRRTFSSGVSSMAKLEALTFTIGLMLSGLLMFATVAPIA